MLPHPHQLDREPQLFPMKGVTGFTVSLTLPANILPVGGQAQEGYS